MIPLASKRQSGMTLVELLVAMLIMGVLSTMIIGSWIALTNAYSFTSRSNKQRDFASQAIARMAREIRDAQSVPGSTTAAFVRAYPNEIRFYSTFNMAGASDAYVHPEADALHPQGDRRGYPRGRNHWEFPGPDTVFDNGNDVLRLLVADVVNLRTTDDLFTYHAVNPATGVMYASDGMTTLIPAARIQTVGILLQVDLNPGQSPNYMDLNTTVEPRNMRHM